MGDTLWELSKLMIFKKNLIRNRPFGEYIFFKFSMISSDGFSWIPEDFIGFDEVWLLKLQGPHKIPLGLMRFDC